MASREIDQILLLLDVVIVIRLPKNDRVRATGARSLEFNTCKDTFSWSTPPESPIPRPVSANSALGDSTFSPLRLISEESNNSSCFSVGKNTQRKPCSSFCSTISRSHSHPSFSTGFSSFANNGLKRRLSEVDIPRPALDFDKMKAVNYQSFTHFLLFKETHVSQVHFLMSCLNYLMAF